MSDTPTKENLLNEIERLIAYGKKEPTINPDLLQYLSIEDLQNIISKLQQRVGKLNDEDKTWLMRFKRHNDT